MRQIKEAQRKTSSLRRGQKFATIVLKGKFFDTKFISNLISIIEKENVEFRAVDFKVNQNADSQATIQLFAENADDMDNAKDKIEIEAASKDVEILEGSGPAYDEEVPSQDMHQDSF